MQSIDTKTIESIYKEYEEDIIRISDTIEQRYRYGYGPKHCDKKSLFMSKIIDRMDCNTMEIIKEELDPYYVPCLKNVCII